MATAKLSNGTSSKKRRITEDVIPTTSLYTNDRPSKVSRTIADKEVLPTIGEEKEEVIVNNEDEELFGNVLVKSKVTGKRKKYITGGVDNRIKRKRPDTDGPRSPGGDPPPPGDDGNDTADESIPPANNIEGLDQDFLDDDFAYNKPLHIIDHRIAFERVGKWANSTYNNYTRQLSELSNTKSETYGSAEHSRRGFDGDERLFNLRRDLNGFEDKPIELQMKMHEAAFSVEGPMIYGEEFFANKKLILEKNGWEARLSVLFILTQRKMGKTYFLGQHAVIHALNGGRDDLKIACISRTLDQAILTVAISRKLFNTHKRRPDFTLPVNQVRRMVISKDGRESEIRAYR